MRQQLGIAWHVGEVFDAAVKSREAEVLALSAENQQPRNGHAGAPPAAALRVPQNQESLASHRSDLGNLMRSNGAHILPVLQRLAMEDEVPGNGACLPGTGAHCTAGREEGRGGKSEVPLSPAVKKRAKAKIKPSLPKPIWEWRRKAEKGVPGNAAHLPASGSQTAAGTEEGTAGDSSVPISPAEAVLMTPWQRFMLQRFTEEDRTCSNQAEAPAGDVSSTAGTSEVPAGCKGGAGKRTRRGGRKNKKRRGEGNVEKAEAPAGGVSSTAGTSEMPAGTLSSREVLPAGGKAGTKKRTRRGGKRLKGIRGNGNAEQNERERVEDVGPHTSAMGVAAVPVPGESNGGQRFVRAEEAETSVDGEGEEGRALELENEESAGEEFGSPCSSLRDEWFDADEDAASMMKDNAMRDSRQNSLATGL